MAHRVRRSHRRRTRRTRHRGGSYLTGSSKALRMFLPEIWSFSPIIRQVVQIVWLPLAQEKSLVQITEAFQTCAEGASLPLYPRA